MKRRTSIELVGALAMAAGVVVAAAPAGATSCAPGTFLISGLVTDESTGLPLAETTSVSVSKTDGTFDDGLGTVLPDSTWDGCVPPGDYTLSFFADDYNVEWYDNQPDAASATIIHVSADTAGLDAALTPRSTVTITGRVVDQDTAEGLFTSVAVESVDGSFADGFGTDDDGNFSIEVPGPGQYRLNFAADFHWVEWWDNKKKRSKATIITIAPGTTTVGPLDVRLLRCSDVIPDFCFPAHFND